LRLTPEILLAAYAAGIFPMGESADDPELFWVDPRRRGILPLDAFHVPKRLRRVVRQGEFEIRCDSAFEQVIRGCAEATEKRPNTWINDEIVRLYAGLFARGAAHSVESWHRDVLVGGLYGVAIGAAFFGESMFSRVTDASKAGSKSPAHVIIACSPRRSLTARPSRRHCRRRCGVIRLPPCNRARSRRKRDAPAPTAPGLRQTSSR